MRIPYTILHTVQDGQNQLKSAKTFYSLGVIECKIRIGPGTELLFNRKVSKKRILIENIICTLKIFRILSERYRDRRKRFGLSFNLIAAIYNMELNS